MACNCGFSYESVTRYFLYCLRYVALRFSLMTAVTEILGIVWHDMSDSAKIKMSLFGSDNLNLNQNRTIFCSVQKYIKSSERFVNLTE